MRQMRTLAIVVCLASLFAAWPAAAALVDNFDPPLAGVTATQANAASPPGPLVTAGGPTGQFLRLINDGVGSQSNQYSYNQTDAGQWATITADFDFRGMSVDQAADGFSFNLIPTAAYGASGAGPVLGESPNLANAFGVGFHSYNTNAVSVHWNNVQLAQANVATADVNFSDNVANFHRAHVVVQQIGPGSNVTVQLTNDINGAASPTVTALRTYVPYLLPFDNRVHFGGRSGGANMTVDLDNVNVQYSNPYVAPPTIAPTTLSQDFDNLGTTSFTPVTAGTQPGPFVYAGGPTGNYLRLINDGVNSQTNALGFNRAVDGGVSNTWKGTFDFRVASVGTPADGFSVYLLPTATNGDSGAPAIPGPAENPSLPGVFGVGFGLYPGGAGPNDVSIWYNQAQIQRVSLNPGTQIDLDAGVFHRAEIIARQVAGGSNVTVTLTPDVSGVPGTPVNVVTDLFVPNFTPYDYRVAIAGRTGGADMSVDLDNISTDVAPGPQTTNTVQNFDGGGSQYKAYVYAGGNNTHPSLVNVGGAYGNVLRVLNSVNSTNNVVGFDRSAPGVYGQVVADWDFSILPGADGAAFELLNTAYYGASGAAPNRGDQENPNWTQTLGVGFGIYNNINRISLNWDGAQRAAVTTYDYRGPGMKHAHLAVDYVTGGANVSLLIDGNPIFTSQFIAGMAPYEGRVGFGARTGGVNTTFDIDNINVQFNNPLAPPESPPFHWRGPTGSYATGTNWTGNNVPTGNDNAYIEAGRANSDNLVVQGSGSVNVSGLGYLYNNGVLQVASGAGTTGNFVQTGGSVYTSGDFYLANANGAVGNYSISGDGTLTVGGTHTVVGRSGVGHFLQSGNSLVSLRRLFLAEFAGSAGSTYQIDGGTLNVAYGAGPPYDLEIARGFNATFIQNGGTVNVANTAIVGNGYTSGGSTGTYNMTAGTLNVGAMLRLAPIDGGTGNFNQSGGAVNVAGRFEMSDSTTSQSTYNLSGNGSLTVNGDYFIVGRQGLGTFNQSGDSTVNVNVAQRMLIADMAGSAGSAYNLSGGTLNISGGRELSIGKAGAGTFTQTGGTVYASGNVRLGEAGNAGVYNLQGGDLHVATLLKDTNGQFNFTGGALHADNVQFALTNAGGALAPGHPLGVTNINGGYTQESDGTLDIELGGYTQGTEYDFVNVTGLASLDGSVDVSLINSFQPKLGDRFDVLLASNGIDDLGLDVNFGPPAGFSYSIVPWGGSAEMLELQYVPEPGAWVLLALGAVALAGWGYRRTKRSAR